MGNQHLNVRITLDERSRYHLYLKFGGSVSSLPSSLQTPVVYRQLNGGGGEREGGIRGVPAYVRHHSGHQKRGGFTSNEGI